VIDELSDAEAIRRIQAVGADVQAFRQLYDRHVDWVRALIRRLVRRPELVDDGIQETFLRLYRSRDKLDPSRPLQPYLRRIAHNVTLGLLDSLKKSPSSGLPPDFVPDPLPGPLEGVIQSEGDRRIEEALQALAPVYRAVLVLRYGDRLKVTEVAEVLDCSERTARNRMRSAAVMFERELRNRNVLTEGERS